MPSADLRHFLWCQWTSFRARRYSDFSEKALQTARCSDPRYFAGLVPCVLHSVPKPLRNIEGCTRFGGNTLINYRGDRLWSKRSRSCPHRRRCPSPQQSPRRQRAGDRPGQPGASSMTARTSAGPRFGKRVFAEGQSIDCHFRPGSAVSGQSILGDGPGAGGANDEKHREFPPRTALHCAGGLGKDLPRIPSVRSAPVTWRRRMNFGLARAFLPALYIA